MALSQCQPNSTLRRHGPRSVMRSAMTQHSSHLRELERRGQHPSPEGLQQDNTPREMAREDHREGDLRKKRRKMNTQESSMTCTEIHVEQDQQQSPECHGILKRRKSTQAIMTTALSTKMSSRWYQIGLHHDHVRHRPLAVLNPGDLKFARFGSKSTLMMYDIS